MLERWSVRTVAGAEQHERPEVIPAHDFGRIGRGASRRKRNVKQAIPNLRLHHAPDPARLVLGFGLL